MFDKHKIILLWPWDISFSSETFQYNHNMTVWSGSKTLGSHVTLHEGEGGRGGKDATSGQIWEKSSAEQCNH